MQYIQLLFKLLFELLDERPELYLKKWYVDNVENDAIYIILVRKNKIGYSHHTPFLRLDSPHPEEDIKAIIESCKEFIDGEEKE